MDFYINRNSHPRSFATTNEISVEYLLIITKMFQFIMFVKDKILFVTKTGDVMFNVISSMTIVSYNLQ